jgi:tape measure domain-containing protein
MGLSGEITSASDSAQKFASTLNFAGVSEKQIKRLTASTQDYADKTVYDLNDIRNTTAQLAANGVPNYDKLAEAAGNLNAVAGGSADTFKSVAMVLTQTAGQGKLTTENWNQLSDAIPGASGKIQQALKEAGAYTGNFRNALAGGQITAQEFNDAIMSLGFTDAAVEAATSASTIEGATGNLEAAFVKLGASVLDSVKPAITGGMSWIADGVTNAVPVVQAGIEGLIGWFQRLYSKLEENGAITAFKSAWDTIRDAIMGVVNMVIDWAHMIPPEGLADGIKLVADTLNWFIQHGKELAPIIIGIGTAFAAVKGYQALNSGLQALTGTMNTVTTAAKGISNGIMLMMDLGGPIQMLKQMAPASTPRQDGSDRVERRHQNGDRRAGRVQRRHSGKPHWRYRRRHRGRRGRARLVLHPDRGRPQGMGRVHLMLTDTWNTIVATAQDLWNGLGEFLANLWATITGTVQSAWDASPASSRAYGRRSAAASPAHGRRSPRSCPACGPASARPPRRSSPGYETSSSTCSPSSARSSSHPCRRSRTASTPCSAGYSRSSPSR